MVVEVGGLQVPIRLVVEEAVARPQVEAVAVGAHLQEVAEVAVARLRVVGAEVAVPLPRGVAAAGGRVQRRRTRRQTTWPFSAW